MPNSEQNQALSSALKGKTRARFLGLTFDDVVRFTGFVTDRAFFPIYSAVRARYVPKPLFASTLVIVSGFTLPQFKVEVEVTAMK